MVLDDGINDIYNSNLFYSSDDDGIDDYTTSKSDGRFQR